MLTLLASGDPALTTVGAVLVGLGMGAEVDLIAYLQSRYFGLRAFGQIYGYLFAVFTVGTGLGPFLMGAAYDATGSYRVRVDRALCFCSCAPPGCCCACHAAIRFQSWLTAMSGLVRIRRPRASLSSFFSSYLVHS